VLVLGCAAIILESVSGESGCIRDVNAGQGVSCSYLAVLQ
jgi:hypothetical protein